MIDETIYNEIFDEFCNYLLEFLKDHFVPIVKLPSCDNYGSMWVCVLGTQTSGYNEELSLKLLNIIKSKTSCMLDVLECMVTISENGGIFINMTDIGEFEYVTTSDDIPVAGYVNLEEKFDNCEWEPLEVSDHIYENIESDFIKFISDFCKMMTPLIKVTIDERAIAYMCDLDEYADNCYNELISITKRYVDEPDSVISVARKIYQDSFHGRFIDIGEVVPYDIYIQDAKENGIPIVLHYTIRTDDIKKALGILLDA